ncbi:hypothetical protein LY90DRAFT_708960 [Neocallimastix californiae]|uniref:Uncharacterized protein n=1 Tax=Neocallimastix californiae TaxID=1754190 RepID=A0A1Y1ZHW9_9FUNG|nr:hypothetical protein LY90DRAFT_708960 [Neocallimastix californiae]|eukprot:ORY09794.1 hypothetical protein LY90DRAFT_708960 [Neocallimastix californiae]
MDSIKKPFSYIGIKNEKYHFYSPISETTLAYSEFDSSEGEIGTPISENQAYDDEINQVNYTKSDPSRFIYVPKRSTINEQNTNDNNCDTNQYIDTNLNFDNNQYYNKNNNENNEKQYPILSQNIHPYATISSISGMNKYKKLKLPWYLKKRQTSFSNTDIKTFYNYNKCSDYEKYENYFSKIHHLTKTDENSDISLDRTAIELKELHFNSFNSNDDNQDYHNTNSNLSQQQSELEETEQIVEMEIAKGIDGIALNEVKTNTDNKINVLSGSTVLDNNNSSPNDINKNNYIENNVTFEFQ